MVLFSQNCIFLYNSLPIFLTFYLPSPPPADDHCLNTGFKMYLCTGSTVYFLFKSHFTKPVQSENAIYPYTQWILDSRLVGTKLYLKTWKFFITLKKVVFFVLFCFIFFSFFSATSNIKLQLTTSSKVLGKH